MAPSPEDPTGDFLEYFEPDISEVLLLISFFFLLSVSEWLSSKVFKVGPVGQIMVGMIYGVPIGNLISLEWQQTFVSLGYLGLILVVFEGGLTINIESMKKHIFMIIISGSIGLLIPMAVSLGFLHGWLQFGKVESFIIGASLSATSLGTTFVVISTVVKDFDFSRIRIGTILIGSVVLNDTVGLIVSAVIDGLGEAQRQIEEGEDADSVVWVVAKPVFASVGIMASSVLLTKYLFGPVFRWYIEPYFAKFKHVSNIFLMVLALTGFMSLASYAGTSTLLGALTAGLVLARLPCIHPDSPFMVLSREHGETEPGKTPNFTHTFEKYFLGGQKYILEPMFFASVGFAIPFKDMFETDVLWKGAVYSILMLFSKVVLALLIPIYDLLTRHPLPPMNIFMHDIWQPALIMGFGMVARGDIGLLTIQVGHNHTTYISTDAFCIAIWAILTNTIIGPVYIGLLMRSFGSSLAEDPRWGLLDDGPTDNNAAWEAMNAAEKTPKWTDRMHSRSVSRTGSFKDRPSTSNSQRSFGSSRRSSSDTIVEGVTAPVFPLRRLPTIELEPPSPRDPFDDNICATPGRRGRETNRLHAGHMV